MSDTTKPDDRRREQRLLVMRFSALGDVALTVPVFRTLEQLCPHLQIDLATQPGFRALFEHCANVRCIETDIYGRHQGLTGHFKMFHEISKHRYDAIVDIHDVLRTRLLSALFKLKGKDVITYRKHRRERLQAIAKRQPERVEGHVVEHYLSAFNDFGAPSEIAPGPWLSFAAADIQDSISNQQWDELPRPWIGFAPFSAHPSKEWNLQHAATFLRHCTESGRGTVFCMAFGPRETAIAAGWKERYPALQVVGATIPLHHQLRLIAAMEVMVTMDSVHLHLASLTGTPSISLWGPTHPDMGFGPLGKNDIILQPSAEAAPWRPLSVYGKVNNRNLKRASEAMTLIAPEEVYHAVQSRLS